MRQDNLIHRLTEFFINFFLLFFFFSVAARQLCKLSYPTSLASCIRVIRTARQFVRLSYRAKICKTISRIVLPTLNSSKTIVYIVFLFLTSSSSSPFAYTHIHTLAPLDFFQVFYIKLAGSC